ncbi:GAF domain-containing protein [Thalassotalea eurytherma]|uniref:GAF domain-containing protein n=1 Tax=Thalassotalea eurytherma TaxID=1144278 RepID=A0ABQ6GYJ0_9GAMM|nr:GAF domain-containing protein [Thalassotalea eurytherma]GLX80937.1 hypothetical protein theurythT_03890 [Thalassotalea eurytherma]
MDAVTKLSMTLSKPRQSTDSKLQEICLCIQRLIPQADRISLWSLSDAKDNIVCHLMIDSAGQTTSNTVLEKRDFSEYFDAILKHQVVNAPDARKHPSTACFNEGYFIPNDIFSLFDYIIHHDFEPVGIICCESTRQVAQWREDQIKSLKRIANISSLFFAQNFQQLRK